MIKDNFRSKIKDYSREPRGPSRNQSLPKYKMHEARIPRVRGTSSLSLSLFLSLCLYVYTNVYTFRNDSHPPTLPHLKADGCIRARAPCAYYILRSRNNKKVKEGRKKHFMNDALSLNVAMLIKILKFLHFFSQFLNLLQGNLI
jgi:hypothetical protein